MYSAYSNFFFLFTVLFSNGMQLREEIYEKSPSGNSTIYKIRIERLPTAHYCSMECLRIDCYKWSYNEHTADCLLDFCAQNTGIFVFYEKLLGHFHHSKPWPYQPQAFRLEILRRPNPYDATTKMLHFHY